jgi:ankyrin repeat protein
MKSDHALQEPYPGATPLATAAWKGQVDKVKKLLKEGADVNKRGDSVDKGASPEAPLLLAVDKASHLRHL